jgi:hypothetical protein
MGLLIRKYQNGGTASDSLNHQRDKTIQYEIERGGAQGNPLPQYKDPSYTAKYDTDVKPFLDS